MARDKDTIHTHPPMDTTTHTRGYSEFFASGIRLVSRRFEDIRTSSPISLTFDTLDSDFDTYKPTKKHIVRPGSMIITLPKSVMGRDNKAQRRSSIISISSRLFGRKPQSISNEESGWVSSSSTSSFHDALDFWEGETSNSPLPSCPNGGIEHLQPQSIDPFSPSPSSKSFFADIQDLPVTGNSSSSGTSSVSLPSHKRDSFLHITSTPPPDASFLHLPRTRRSMGRDRRTRRREHPASVDITPTSLPTATATSIASPPIVMSSVNSSPQSQSRSHTRSRVSSPNSSSIFISVPENTGSNRDKNNATPSGESVVNVIEEEEGPVSATDAQIFFSREDDAPATMDWRQFHIELLDTQDA